MHLTEEERAMLAGEHGEPRRRALALQIEIGRVFDAPDFVEVSQAHVMADTESLGEAGVEFLESLANHDEADRRVRVPTITDPRGIDFCAYRRLRQKDEWAAQERRAIDAMRALGILMTDTCINYQTVSPPVFGEHAAFGDTGVVIYSNSVCGARSNFEGGPAAISAGLTGRTPRYGCHLDRHRRGTHRFEVETRPGTLDEWGALGAIVGRAVNSYWHVPVVDGIDGAPTSDELKHFGAALASYGSVPMFHMIGVTPEALDPGSVFDAPPRETRRIGQADLDAFHRSFGRHAEGVRRGGLRRPPAFAGGAATARRSAARTAHPSGHHNADRHVAGEQGGLRPHGLHGSLRGRRRPAAPGRVLLPDAGAGDGPDQRLAAAPHQLRQARQHHPGIRIRSGHRLHGGVRGGGGAGAVLMGAGNRAGRELRGHPGIGERVSGVVLAAADDFSARYDLDRIRGIFSRPAHALHGESYVGRVLALNTAKGGVATAWMLREMRSRGMAPAALLLNRANPIMVQGAAFAELPFIDRFDVDITRSLRTGDTVTVYPREGLVRIESSADSAGADK